MTEFPVAVQRLVVIVPKEEQSGEEQHGEEGADATADDVDHLGVTSTRGAEQPLRRSRRVRGEPPDPILAAIGHNLVSNPWDDSNSFPAAAISLHAGALPLLVPAWLPEILVEDPVQKDQETFKKVMHFSSI